MASASKVTTDDTASTPKRKFEVPVYESASQLFRRRPAYSCATEATNECHATLADLHEVGEVVYLVLSDLNLLCYEEEDMRLNRYTMILEALNAMAQLPQRIKTLEERTLRQTKLLECCSHTHRVTELVQVLQSTPLSMELCLIVADYAMDAVAIPVVTKDAKRVRLQYSSSRSD